ncbi:MAG: 23S rRNA (uracil-C(5))-methyltransferase RlmCD [Elusimicrobia bacterium ADurb.Bin231]|nr:MAG: 23S rRNA (uracil-C(5))-methyltransferase RlmCD [Elusimicrobia bacterium ADurb.Bin231]
MTICGHKIELNIKKVTAGGHGIGYYAGKSIIVPYAVPGDLLSVKIKNDSAFAEIIDIKKFSEFRKMPDCPFHYAFDKSKSVFCGGCNLQMMNYTKQLDCKLAIVNDLPNLKAPEIIPSEHIFAYRNKIQMPTAGKKGKIITGIYQQGTHKITPVKNCLLHSSRANALLNDLQIILNKSGIPPYDETTRSGILRHIILRQSFFKNEFMLILVTKTKYCPSLKYIISGIRKKYPDIVSIFLNINPRKTNVILGDVTINLTGKKRIMERIEDLFFEISPNSFFQINTAQTERLYNTIRSYADLKGQETVFDLYSGCGGISLYLSRFCKNVVGIEKVSSAVEDARRNAALNGIKNIRFIRENAEYAIRKISQKRNSVFILDPPRAGCSEIILQSILKYSPSIIIYASCNPITLSRDMDILSEKYKLDTMKLVDMFPQTAHIECVARLIKS